MCVCNCTTPPASLQNATKKIGLEEKKASNQEEEGVVQNLHIPAFKACATEQHHLFKSDEYNELIGQRSLSPSCPGGQPDCPEEQEGNAQLEGDPDGSEAGLPGRAGHPRLR